MFRQEPNVNMWAWGSDWPPKSGQLNSLDLTGRQDAQWPVLLVRAQAPAHKLLLGARSCLAELEPFTHSLPLPEAALTTLVPSQRPLGESFFFLAGMGWRGQIYAG